MIKLNGPKGLGDAIYLRALALHLLDRGETIDVRTRWPQVFADLPVTTRPADNIDDYDELKHMTACLYCNVPQIRMLDKFRLACLQAGFDEAVELRMGWTIKNAVLIETVKTQAAGRPLMLYQPLKLSRGAEQEALRPRRQAYSGYVNSRTDCFRVKTGHPNHVQMDPALDCEMDLIGKASISDVFDVAAASDAIFAEDSYLSILAQALDKPLVCMFSRRALDSRNARLCNSGPARMFTKPRFATAIYDDDGVAA